jgi:hypothetical protein
MPACLVFLRASQVYGNQTAVDDELVDVLLTPGQDDGAEEVFLKVLRAPAGPSPEELLPRIQVPVIGIWGVRECSTGGGGGGERELGACIVAWLGSFCASREKVGDWLKRRRW